MPGTTLTTLPPNRQPVLFDYPRTRPATNQITRICLSTILATPRQSVGVRPKSRQPRDKRVCWLTVHRTD